MSILQKINTGGWDQNIVDEMKLGVVSGLAWELIDVMIDRIDDTLGYDDLKEEVDTLAVNRDRLEDEISELEDKNEELTKQLGAVKADLACVRMHHNHRGECFGKHKVT